MTELCPDNQPEYIHATKNSKKYQFKIQKGNNNAIKIDYEWFRKSDEQVTFTFYLIDALIRCFGNFKFEKWNIAFTEAAKGDMLLQSDFNYRSTGGWFDNVNVAWEKDSKQKTYQNNSSQKEEPIKEVEIVLAQIHMLFQLEKDNTI